MNELMNIKAIEKVEEEGYREKTMNYDGARDGGDDDQEEGRKGREKVQT